MGAFFTCFFSIHSERTCMLADQFEILASGKLMQYKSIKVTTEDHTHGFPKLTRSSDTLSENRYTIFTSYIPYFLHLSSYHANFEGCLISSHKYPLLSMHFLLKTSCTYASHKMRVNSLAQGSSSPWLQTRTPSLQPVLPKCLKLLVCDVRAGEKVCSAKQHQRGCKTLISYVSLFYSL